MNCIKSFDINNCILRIICTIITIFASQNSDAKTYVNDPDSISADTSSNKGNKTFAKKISRTFDRVYDFFMGCDTSYITPQLYNVTTQLELSRWHDFYYISSSASGKRKSMNLQSNPSMVLGGYVYFGIIGLGHSINLDDIGRKKGETNGTGQRWSLALNTGRFAAEVYKFNSGKTARITSVTGVDMKGLDNKFHGLDANCKGLNLEYIFNNRRYSWPAAFGENAVQRRSCGSWKLGFSMSSTDITFNKDEIPSDLVGKIDPSLLFDKIEYKDYAISFGYGYNWVFKRNCLLAVSLLPSIGYRSSNVSEDKSSKFNMENISTDLIARASLFWNNTKYFTGLVFEMHTYAYREKHFGLTNSFGTFKLIVGLNIFKKSQYKQK